MHLLLLSGLLSDKRLWKHQASHLGDLGEVQIFSLAKDSAKKMVDAILAKAPETFALVGHSMGGWIALEIMRVAPSRVSHLILLNTTARADSDEKRQKRLEMIEAAKGGNFEKIARQITEKFVYNKTVKEAVLKMFLEVGSDLFVRQQTAMLVRDECFSILPKITCPTLVIHASKDQNFSLKEHEELSTQIKAAKLSIIENAGHMSPMEEPKAITDLLKLWLKTKISL